jgi:transcriptional regulator with XRE-family HTH domain
LQAIPVRLRKQFGQRLLSIRQQRRLTQEQFAELVGISVDFLSLIERGINAPSFETLEVLAKRLGIPVAHLFMFDEAPLQRRSRRLSG